MKMKSMQAVPTEATAPLSKADQNELDREVILGWAAHFLLDGGVDETARYCLHIGMTPADLQFVKNDIGAAFVRGPLQP
jgi:hypothetical protein